jgi:peptide chain release factor 1
MERPASGGVFSYSVEEEADGYIRLKIKGNGAWELFRNEGGGHRWQGIPVTEKNGRRHSSTFTVAVFLDEDREFNCFSEEDIKLEATVGHGPGGQHRNKTATAIRATHEGTGVSAFIQGSRSQQANKQKAMEVVKQRVLQKVRESTNELQNSHRKQQIGSGERSDKVRTVQEQHGKVTNHLTGKTCSLASYIKGEIWKING